MSETMKVNAISASAFAGKATVLVKGGIATVAAEAVGPAIPRLSSAAVVSAPIPDGGVVRSQLTVPVSPVQPPTDTALFEQPADANQKLYLPVYAVSQQTVSGMKRYRMLFKQVGTSIALIVHLAKITPPGLEQAVSQGAQELTHTPSVRLVLPAPFQGKTALPFTEVVSEEGGISATLLMSDLDEVNQVFNALTDTNPNSPTKLIVSRAFQAAVMITQPAGPGEVDQLNQQKAQLQGDMTAIQSQSASIAGTPDPLAGINNLQAQNNQRMATVNQLQASIPGLQHEVNDAQQAIDDYLSSLSDLELPTPLGKPGPRPHPNPVLLAQLRSKLAAAQARLNAANAAIQQNQAAIAAVNQSIAQLQAMIQRLAADQVQLTRVSQRLDEINNPRFTVVSPTLDDVVNPSPFIFRKDLNAYIYSALTGGDVQGLAAYQATWNGRVFHYYQNPAESNVFYYLPDSFKQTRRSDTPHTPNMRVQFKITGGSTGGVQAMMDYQVVPWVDLRRLTDAAGELSKHIDDGNSAVQFEPLAVGSNKVTLFLVLPPSGSPQDMTASAQVDFQNGITGTLTMNLEDFQNAFSAMLGGSLTLLTGHVHITLNDQDSDDVPLIIRMDDLEGEIFDYQVSPDATSGGVQVTLCNAIESALQVSRLGLVLTRGTAQVEGIIQGVHPALPCTLQPGDSVICTVVPPGPLPGDGDLSAQFDVSGVKALPDHKLVWDAILDHHTPAEYLQEIIVETFAQTYNAPTDPVTAVLIQFEHGDSIVADDGTLRPGNTAQMDAGHLNAKVNIRLPISDFVLQTIDEGQYGYKLTIIRGGAQAQDAQWRTDSRTTLPVTIGDVPNH